MIQYQIESKITVSEFIDVLASCSLGIRRPLKDATRIQKMINHANLIVTARDNGKLIAVARSLSDFAFCTYMSDLAVNDTYQKKGIGKELIKRTKLAAPQAKLILISAPQAETYYPKIGMSKRDHCFTLDDINNLQ